MRDATATPEDERPSTPEAALIRYYVQRLSPVPTAAEMAQRMGWGTEKWGANWRGRTRARRGNPAREHHPSPADMVRLAVELGISAEELRQAGRVDAAERLAASPPPVPSQSRPGIDPADVDRLARALLKYAPQAEVDPLWYMLHATHGDNELRPFADRVDLVENWVNRVPAKPAQVTLKRA